MKFSRRVSSMSSSVSSRQQRPAHHASRVVHQDVDATVAETQRLADQAVDVGLPGHVGLHRERASAERDDVAGRGVRLRGAAAVVDDDVGSLAG